MAFNNSVPVTLNVSHDNGTNLITFTLTTYAYNNATRLYDTQQGAAEVIEIPADACSHNEVIGKVVTVQNASQDEFEITTGWYDVVNDVHYPNPGQPLVDLIDTYIALNTGGGGGSTTIFYAITEAAAITLAGGTGFERGATYRITLDGTSSGNNGDYFYGLAITTARLSCLGYYHAAEAQNVIIEAYFDNSGMFFKQADPTASITNPASAFDKGTDTLDVTNYEPFGEWAIDLDGSNEDLDTITGGFEGMEITIYATGGGAFILSVLDTGNIVFDQSGYTMPAPVTILDDNEAFAKLRKRGSNWLLIQSFIQ